ncbi:2-polyprenyl-6-methoxyphenol hydroxylase-like FAD-dependent oxidoreductase [Luteibacter rhizovicinus]|uniref:2-polyprenyl-6-methoxyphenol hydroxylase-like FAD-dependent oxidoreductase n=1 Tax=Luteibacter rhizovicinus TaxID=242606 RepID=A0A4R3YXM3_9GAMM|nr:FAD-dependent monooxygenase [Luteibacter rhizovicinus]TCV97380.1 2-polyprenyl-6-methoxyphenol hydroxylase-like FAD-dependent oxidoreductase [Luteibacter rhizovicinus]
MSDPSFLIAGAGPTGLAAALFLKRRGITARLVDKAEQPAAHSRALVVNPRTLDMLKSSGVTDRMLAEGRPVSGLTFYDHWKRIASFDTSAIHPRYQLNVISQERSEALLAEALATYGIHAERSTTASVKGQDEHVHVELTHGDGRTEQIDVDGLFAADGARSTIRENLGIPFPGTSFPEAWPLFDIEMETSLALDRAHVCFLPEGLIFMLALDARVWRVIASFPNPLDHLPNGSRAGDTVWSSSFHIAHRIAETCAIGRVALGGDAAHIHSPIGARGMNLGIEDGYAFALRMADTSIDLPARFARYGTERHAIHVDVVRRVRMVTTLARGGTGALRLIRRYGIPLIVEIAPMRHLLLGTAAGLDHPQPI